MSRIRLKSIEYHEFLGTPKEWKVDVQFSQIDLLVGKNATGKTRVLNVIGVLARLFAPIQKFYLMHVNYNVEFQDVDSGDIYSYVLKINERKIVEEKFLKNKEIYLERNRGEVAKIRTYGVDFPDGYVLSSFSPPENELAVVVRRDEIQHPFLNVLYEWGEFTRHYTFGSLLGKESLFLQASKDSFNADDRDINQVVAIFNKANNEFPGEFKSLIKQDMADMGYHIDDIELVTPQNVKLQQVQGGGQDLNSPQISCLAIKEEGLDRKIEQREMSQGMFRALSILIQVNYSQLAKRANCILVDDIGEGLDFERSSALISILRKKAQESSFQLLMTTNDRFVMNNVPLEEWVILERNGGIVTARTYENSKDMFESFKFTGLSNFTLFESNFFESYFDSQEG